MTRWRLAPLQGHEIRWIRRLGSAALSVLLDMQLGFLHLPGPASRWGYIPTPRCKRNKEKQRQGFPTCVASFFIPFPFRLFYLADRAPPMIPCPGGSNPLCSAFSFCPPTAPHENRKLVKYASGGHGGRVSCGLWAFGLCIFGPALLLCCADSCRFCCSINK